MKKIGVLSLVFLLTQTISFSQIDLKGGLFASIPFGIYASGEYGIYEDIGIELGVVSNTGSTLGQTHVSGSAIIINARYYFSPKYGLDRFYTGMYIRPHTTLIKEEFNNFFFGPSGGSTTTSTFEYSRDSGVGIGIILGKKFVQKNNFFIDFNFGLGKNIGRKVYDQEVPTSPFGRQNERVNIDIFYAFSFGYRL